MKQVLHYLKTTERVGSIQRKRESTKETRVRVRGRDDKDGKMREREDAGRTREEK